MQVQLPTLSFTTADIASIHATAEVFRNGEACTNDYTASTARSSTVAAELPARPDVSPAAAQCVSQLRPLALSIAKEHSARPSAQILSLLGDELGREVIAVLASTALTPKQAYGKYNQAVRAARAELGAALQTSGQQTQQHREQDYQHVITLQLNSQLKGTNPTPNELLNAAFPDDPAKAKSLGNSTRKARWKGAYNASAVSNHPVEKAMRTEHGKASMNLRNTAGTFAQSLGIHRNMFNSYDKATKLEARVRFLEQQMASTKSREALDDAGFSTSKEKVLALYSQGERQTAIATQLGMPINTVKAIIRRSKGN